jgi:2-polyprenyl-3-methyl-5-hydroxy-6-metoxy-1,4-benzoquinol methylase
MRIGDYFIQWWRMRVAARWIPSGCRILDIGCHQGEFLTFLGDRIAPSVGIDPLYQAKHELKQHQLLPWEFHEGMPFEENSFDVITLLATLEHMQKKDMVAREVKRLLTPGGRVVITVPDLMVDKILEILLALKLVDGMSLDEHHGFLPEEVPDIFLPEGLKLIKLQKFQLGLNHLYIFERV